MVCNIFHLEIEISLDEACVFLLLKVQLQEFLSFIWFRFWLYEDFFSINVVNERPRHSSADSSANTRHEDQFNIQVRKKGGKSDSMRFSSEFAREIVTEALRFQNRFASDRADQKPRFPCRKIGWSEKPQNLILEVSACSINQLEANTNSLLKNYNYKDIRLIIPLKGRQQDAFIIELGEQRRRIDFVKVLGYLFFFLFFRKSPSLDNAFL
ncbi:unnamed protein product [Meloidogyne enterolobii]|uniref:Uncharacterized protein n=1 Tax=Meloidogyne enterolobii TaxID=390850 RepID=A0ACB1ACW0_MELEN